MKCASIAVELLPHCPIGPSHNSSILPVQPSRLYLHPRWCWWPQFSKKCSYPTTDVLGALQTHWTITAGALRAKLQSKLPDQSWNRNRRTITESPLCFERVDMPAVP